MTRLLLTVGVVALSVSGGAAQDQDAGVSAATVEAIDRWTGHVLSHVPGEADKAVRAVWALTLEDRQTMHLGMEILLEAISGRSVKTKFPTDQRVVAIGVELARTPGVAEFLMRAAVLHGDAAMLGYQPPSRRPLPPNAPPPTSAEAAMRAPLLTDRVMYLENDGQVVGFTVSDWNWTFARSLLGRLRAPGAYPFVGQWYHATMAFMFGERAYGEVQWHLDQAAQLLPNDARILLDRGGAFEQQGLPRSQSALSEDSMRRQTTQSGTTRMTVDMSYGLNLGIESVGISNRKAEDFYRKAIERDPRLFEARVRLARLLTLKSKWAEALEMITEATAGTAPDVIAEYYAHLFAARAERGLGRLDNAAGRIRQARSLFPDAQSALMAESHVAMLQANEAGAEAPMQHLARLPYIRTPKDDPWWVYETFTGRYARELIVQMWKDSGFSPRVPSPSSAR